MRQPSFEAGGKEPHIFGLYANVTNSAPNAKWPAPGLKVFEPAKPAFNTGSHESYEADTR